MSRVDRVGTGWHRADRRARRSPPPRVTGSGVPPPYWSERGSGRGRREPGRGGAPGECGGVLAPPVTPGPLTPSWPRRDVLEGAIMGGGALPFTGGGVIYYRGGCLVPGWEVYYRGPLPG